MSSSTTEVNLTAPVELKSVVSQNMSTTGFGVMGDFGLGPLFMSVDANWTWTKPNRNIAFLVGGIRLRMSSATVGSVRMGDAIPQETWDRVDEIVDDNNTRYEGLDPIRQDIVDNSAFPAFIDLKYKSTVRWFDRHS